MCRQSYFLVNNPLLIVVEGAETPAGGRDMGDPAGEAEEAPGPPAGKRSSWNEDQQENAISKDDKGLSSI